jgi:hypothetical protein
MRPNKAKVMANRIKARTGIEYNSNAIKEVSYQNKSNIVPLMKKRELLEQNYYKRLIPRRKNNVNINSSSLY